jgi:hypothetical protein
MCCAVTRISQHLQHGAMQRTAPADAGFDAAAATGLYWRSVPVMLRLPEREEHVADLTVRIMSTSGRSSHASRVHALSLRSYPPGAPAAYTFHKRTGSTSQ